MSTKANIELYDHRGGGTKLENGQAGTLECFSIMISSVTPPRWGRILSRC